MTSGGEELGERSARPAHPAGRISSPSCAFAQAEFLCAAHHPLAFDTAQFAHLDREISGQHRAGQRERHLVPDAVILRPANDLDRAGHCRHPPCRR